MKHTLRVLIFIFSALAAAFAQGPDTLWTRTYGGATDDWGYDVIRSSDGNYVIAGATRSYGVNPAAGNAYILKVNDNGDTLWTKVYGGAGGEDVDAVRQTSDGGYILAGYTSTSGAGAADFYLVKLTSLGNISWSRTFGGADYEEARAVRQTNDGGFVIVGYTRSFGVGVPSQENFFIVKTNANGDSVWARTYGGPNGEIAYGVEQTPDGGYMVAGYTGSYGSGTTDMWLLRLNANGDTLWTNTYGGPGPEAAYWLTATSDGAYALAGYSASFTPGVNDQYLVKVDPYGNELWSNHYGGVDHDQAYCVQQTLDGGYILSGITKSFGQGVPAQNNFYVVKTDAGGTALWSRFVGGTGNEVASAVREVAADNYIVAGYTRSYGPGIPSANVYLVRYYAPFAPHNLTIRYQGGNLNFHWADDANPYYRIYSGASPDGPFDTLVGSTSGTSFTTSDASALLRFYVVVASDAP